MKPNARLKPFVAFPVKPDIAWSLGMTWPTNNDKSSNEKVLLWN
jgi:hypothetical protein